MKAKSSKKQSSKFSTIKSFTLRFLSIVGSEFQALCYIVGEYFVMSFSFVYFLLARKIYWREVRFAFFEMSFKMITLLAPAGFFIGVVLAVQSHIGFSRFNAEASLPLVVSLSLVRELGPITAAMFSAGKVAARLAAEIGTMQVSRQISAIKTLNVSPANLLFAPNIISGICAIPIMTVLVIVMGIFGGYSIGVGVFGFSSQSYIEKTINVITAGDLVSVVVKGSVFGFILTSIGCYSGYRAQHGSRGVGVATTSAVVVVAMVIIVADFIITAMLM